MRHYWFNRKTLLQKAKDRYHTGVGREKAAKYYLYFEWKFDHIIKIINSLEHLGVLIDGVTETVKHETKKQKGWPLAALLAPLATSSVQPVISSAVKGMNGGGVRRVGRDMWKKNFSSAPSFKIY